MVETIAQNAPAKRSWLEHPFWVAVIGAVVGALLTFSATEYTSWRNGHADRAKLRSEAFKTVFGDWSERVVEVGGILDRYDRSGILPFTEENETKLVRFHLREVTHVLLIKECAGDEVAKRYIERVMEPWKKMESQLLYDWPADKPERDKKFGAIRGEFERLTSGADLGSIYTGVPAKN